MLREHVQDDIIFRRIYILAHKGTRQILVNNKMRQQCKRIEYLLHSYVASQECGP